MSQRCGDRPVAILDPYLAHVLAGRGRQVAPLQRRGQYRGELGHLLHGRGLKIGGHRKEVRKAAWIQECDARAAHGRLAHAAREQRQLAAQVRADDEQRIERIHVCDRHTERGLQPLAGLAVEVEPAQAMIDVRAA